MMRQEGEPSVEEILESIKKVIARDNRELADAQRRRRETEGLVAQPAPRSMDDRPMDGRVFDARPVEARPAMDERPVMEDDILDLGVLSRAFEDDAADDDTAEPATGLTNEEAADAMRQSLAALAMLAEPPASPKIVRSGETSLEGMVREMLRPMMAQWLDAHLPEIVERLVKAEISRIAGKKR